LGEDFYDSFDEALNNFADNISDDQISDAELDEKSLNKEEVSLDHLKNFLENQ